MKKFVSQYMRALDKGRASPEVDEPRIVERKVPESVLKRREEEWLLGIVDSEDEEDVFAAMLTVDLEYSNHDHSKRARTESELEARYKFHLKRISKAHCSLD